jgi:hypothetical protein
MDRYHVFIICSLYPLCPQAWMVVFSCVCVCVCGWVGGYSIVHSCALSHNTLVRYKIMCNARHWRSHGHACFIPCRISALPQSIVHAAILASKSSSSPYIVSSLDHHNAEHHIFTACVCCWHSWHSCISSRRPSEMLAQVFLRSKSSWQSYIYRMIYFLYIIRRPVFCFLSEKQDSSVGIATGYGLEDRGVGVRVPVVSRIFCAPLRPDRFWSPPNLLSNVYRG